MGQSHSSEPPKEVPIEQLSHELALRFATRCFSHLEIAHYKDNFKTLADHQEDVEYWKEDTLCRFLTLPESLDAGPVLYQMCTYLGAFPFPSLAPCILTREALLKVVTIMTGRYKKILKRGDQDKAKLLFRSLAVFDRKASVSSPREKPDMETVVIEQLPQDMKNAREVETRLAGFAIDDPINDGDEDEDDDDLALAALDSLDAIEVFKHDQRQAIDRKMNHALIPVDNFRKLITLLLLLASAEPLTPLGTYGESLTSDKMKDLNTSADAIIAAFDPDPHSNGIRYQNFVKTITFTLPDLFEPLSPLFEHLLFSRNINLNKHRDGSDLPVTILVKPSPIYRPSDDSAASDTILTDTLLSQLSKSLRLTTPTGTYTNIYTSNARFNLLYSTSSSGTSLSSFSRQVLSWQSGTMLLLSGSTTSEPSQPVTLGAYLPDRWTDSTNKHHAPSAATSHDPNNAAAPCLFLLSPRQALFRSNPYNHTTPASYLHMKTGIALGCVIPPPSRSRSSQTAAPILGPVSISVDSDMSTATFQHDGSAGQGAFTTDAGMELAQTNSSTSPSPPATTTTMPTKTTISLTELEVWGITFPTEAEEDEMVKQAKRLAWEEAEAARRRGVNFGGDQDGARALLEMAGIVGDGGRSGGSV